MKNHPKYIQLLKDIPKIKRYFDVDFLFVHNEKFQLVKFEKIISPNYPLLIIMAGCHGEEPASCLSIFKYYKLFSEMAEKSKINLIFYPLVNPWGFDRNYRRNREDLNCNNNWIHKKDGKIAEEVKTIKKDIKKYKPVVFASLHEEDEVINEFYIFTFGDRKYEKALIKIGKKYFPISKDGTRELNIKGGVVFNDHDGSAEDFMSHRGCKFSCCTETPSAQPLKKRILCNRDLILNLINMSGSIDCK